MVPSTKPSKRQEAPANACSEGRAVAGAETDAQSATSDSRVSEAGGEPKPHTCHSRNAWENVPPEVLEVARNARAVRWWQEAERRLEECPEAKKLIWGMACAEVEAKRRFSFSRIVKDVADKHIVTAGGDDFRVNNNHISAYARMFLLDYPGARKYMHPTRDSMYNFITANKRGDD